MGFINPGKSKRKRNGESLKKSNKRLKNLDSPDLLPITRDDNKKEEVIEDVDLSSLSILERFPIEILHEIFIHAGINELPFVNKNLNHKLSNPSLSLCCKMIKNYIYDLNTEVTHPEIINEFPTRYALDKSILNYRFSTPSVLETVVFDVVLPLGTINAEIKNRLIIYHDKLNKKLLETMYSSDSTADEINAELSRMAEERFNMTVLDEQELSDLPNEDYQDFTQRFYNGPFDECKLRIIEILHSKKVKFINGDEVISQAIKLGSGIPTLERLLRCTEVEKLTTSSAIIEGFQISNFEIIDWCLNNLEDEKLINDDNLWVYLTKKKNMKFLKFMGSKGAVPSHEILGYLNSLHK